MAGRVTVDPPGLVARIATAAALLLAVLAGPISGPFVYVVIGISGLVVATGLGTQSTGQGRFPRGYVIVLGLVFALILRSGVSSSYLVVPLIVAAGAFSQISHERATMSSGRILRASTVAVGAMVIAALLAGLSYSSSSSGGRGRADAAERAARNRREGRDNVISRFVDDAVDAVMRFFGVSDGEPSGVEGDGEAVPRQPPPPDDGPNWWRILLVALIVVALTILVLLAIRWWQRRRGSGELTGSNWAIARLDRIGAAAARERNAGEGPMSYGVAVDRAVDDARVGRAGAMVSEVIYDPSTRDAEHEAAVRHALDDLEAVPPPSVRSRRRFRIPGRPRGR